MHGYIDEHTETCINIHVDIHEYQIFLVPSSSRSHGTTSQRSVSPCLFSSSSSSSRRSSLFSPFFALLPLHLLSLEILVAPPPPLPPPSEAQAFLPVPPAQPPEDSLPAQARRLPILTDVLESSRLQLPQTFSLLARTSRSKQIIEEKKSSRRRRRRERLFFFSLSPRHRRHPLVLLKSFKPDRR